MRSPLKIFEDAIETAGALFLDSSSFRKSLAVGVNLEVGTLVRPFVEAELGFDVYSRTSAHSECLILCALMSSVVSGLRPM